MDPPGWLSQRIADVAPSEAWLGPDERQTLARLTIEPRRDSWRLGRWTLKAALGAWFGLPPSDFQIRPAADGAPEPWRLGRPVPVSVSLSHRAGRALAVIGAAGATVGCDLELVEPRSDAFVREWLAAGEQRLLAAAPAQRALLVNLLWTAKEAAAKVRREGLRLDIRAARVSFDDDGSSSWKRVRVDLTDGSPALAGWWRSEPDWVMTVLAAPAGDPPRALAAGGHEAVPSALSGFHPGSDDA